MNDMSPVIIPKSDQISADDFLAGPRTYLIEDVEIRPGTEQPVSIFMAGEPRAWKPCKSMSRCLVAAWGPDANVYKGRSITLYRDPKVKWGGMEVGGIRVSHMSHIEREMLLQLTATKGKRAPHIVKPLEQQQRQQSSAPDDAAGKWANAYLTKIEQAGSLDALNTLANGKAKLLADLEQSMPNAHRQIVNALDAKRASFADDTDEGPDQSQRGEHFTDDDDPPVWQATVDRIKDMIDGAIGEASWSAAKEEFLLHHKALPTETAAELEKLLADKRGELGL